MKILVIPDVHLKSFIFDKAEEILRREKVDNCVVLGDLVDDWGQQLNVDLYSKTLDRAIRFAKDHPDTLWCYGNHDLSYIWLLEETGFSHFRAVQTTVMFKIQELERALFNKKQYEYIHRVDNCLFMHGGLFDEFVYTYDEKLMRADIDEVIGKINRASEVDLWKDISPIWARPQNGVLRAFREDEYLQIVGHTPVEKIDLKNSFLSVDVFSTTHDGIQIGESAMVIVDTVNKTYIKCSCNN